MAKLQSAKSITSPGRDNADTHTHTHRVFLYLEHYAACLPIGIKITKHPMQLARYSYQLK